MLEQRSSMRLKQLEKYFVPAGIDAKLILQAFKIQENRRMLASCRTRQFAVEQKIEEQVSKLDLLQVTGRQSLLPEPNRRPSHRRGVKEIKIVLHNPITHIVDAIAQDPDSRLYKRELGELKRFSASSPKEFLQGKEVPSPQPKGVHSQKELETPLLQRLQRQGSTEWPCGESMEYYEQLILNNPVLYRKIMMAYNASKRELERGQAEQRRAAQRETAYEARFHLKASPADLTRNVSDPRRPSLLQLREFQLTVCLTNRLLVYPQAELQYRAFVCKGNNGLLVKSILKSRPWWSLRSQNEAESCNLVWTEWKKGKAVQRMPGAAARRGVVVAVGAEALACHSKKRELVLLAEKRQAQFRRVVSPGDQLWDKYEKLPQFENYLKFTSKVADPKFEEIARVVFAGKEYLHREAQKEHRAHNHLPGCLQLHSKKLLFLNLRAYYQKLGRDVFSVLPLTFHVANGPEDPEFIRFAEHFESLAAQGRKGGHNIWILKPGENSNRGNGITVLSSLADIRTFVGQRCGNRRTVIIQKYFQNPFLYNRRKFDLRCYVLVTTVNGVVKGYWYEEGYIRTASKEFSLRHLENKFIHLTNDAVQKKSEEYGKFENYNKLSYADFEKYLESAPEGHAPGASFPSFPDTLARMKEIATDLIRSTARKLNPKRKEYCFELFGLDFMLDDRLAPFLIEANSNPCIEVDGLVLGRVIPALLENVIRVAVDPVFPPPYSESAKNRYQCSGLFEANKMVLVYDSYLEGGGEGEGEGGEAENNNEEENEEAEGEVEE